MEWWQILLIGVASIAAGILLGALSNYLFRRFVKKRETPPAKEREIAPVKEYEATPVKEPEITLAKEPEITPAKEPEITPAKEREITPVKEPEITPVKEPEITPVKEPETTFVIEGKLEWATSDLLEEIESNLKVATEPWTGNLLPFQTRVWDTIQGKVDGIPMNLQDELSQAYIDMRLANSVVRLSTQFHHRTYSLNESYMKLCTSIAEKLDRIKPVIEQASK